VVTGVHPISLDVPRLVDSVRRDDCGALVVFEGTVRSPDRDRAVSALVYEAWEERVEQQIEEFSRDVAQRHCLGAVLAVHRVGRVGVGEPAVVVAAVSAHREVAFVAARELIDRVKAEAWIWKKEIRPDGEAWVDGCL
jgi:molybdopterin synthase catalytic subunit